MSDSREGEFYILESKSVDKEVEYRAVSLFNSFKSPWYLHKDKAIDAGEGHADLIQCLFKTQANTQMIQ